MTNTLEEHAARFIPGLGRGGENYSTRSSQLSYLSTRLVAALTSRWKAFLAI